MSDVSEDDQLASMDEYEIALNEGVDDEALLDETNAKKFQITSYGADYTVDTLVKRMRAEAFIIPEFQRRFVWSIKHASKFIESLLMGLPVPGIFLYKDADTNKHLVIDGQQRLRTLQAFFDGKFRGKVFRLEGIREPWNGKTYETLENSDQLKIDDSIVHATIFQQDSPADKLDSIYFVFERINSGGIRLSPQEIRNCISLGKFITMVKSLNEYKGWRDLFGPVNKRAKDEELIIRFFAMMLEGDLYQRPMVKFLNDFSSRMNKSSPDELESLGKLFTSTVDLIYSAVGKNAFRLVRGLNTAVFDSIMAGLGRRLRSGKPLSEEQVRQAYNALLADPEYRKACDRATADEKNVGVRLRLATAAFSN